MHGQIFLESKDNRPNLSLLESSILYLTSLTSQHIDNFVPNERKEIFSRVQFQPLSEPCPSWQWGSIFRGATSIVRVAPRPSKDFWPLGRRTAMSKMWKFCEGATCNVIWQLRLGHCQHAKKPKWGAWQKLGCVLKNDEIYFEVSFLRMLENAEDLELSFQCVVHAWDCTRADLLEIENAWPAVMNMVVGGENRN